MLLILLMAGIQPAAGINRAYTGMVISEADQSPIPYYDVYFMVNNESLECFTLTDENGTYYYEIDSNPDDTVTVYIYDCQGVVRSTVFPHPDSINIADFAICSQVSQCQAMFYEVVDSLNPMAYQFINISIGNYGITNWDFGDGTFSTDENPYHVFPAEGIYIVSLTIYDSLNPDGCFDFIDQPVFVGQPGDCVADFSFSLDTLNNTPNVYLFENLSEGDDLTYNWDFGDGLTSQEENPQHIYSFPGTYDVYLSVQDLSGNCFDETRKTVVTPAYYDFGGQAFLGDYPINIEPDDHQNSAIAYLYRKMGNRWHYMDKREFWQLGYYWFTKKLEGDYLIRIDLDKNSEAYGEYAPGYYKQAAGWQHATTFTLTAQVFEEAVKLTELGTLDEGINQLSGYIYYDSSLNNKQPLANTLIQLLNESKKVVKFTYSDEEGDFEFNNLPDGTFYIKGEVTGYCSSVVQQELSSGNGTINDVKLTVYDCGTIGIDENTLQNNIEVSLFPVPAKKCINLKLTGGGNGAYNITIINMEGKTMENRRVNLAKDGLIRFDTSRWPNGIYLVKILDTKNNHNLNKKFVISN